jgi:hypothetical protein
VVPHANGDRLQAFISHVSTTFVRPELARAKILFLTDNLSDLFREIPIPRPLNACQSETPLDGNPCEFSLGADTKLAAHEPG